MNSTVALEIADLALSLVRPQQDATVADTLLKIIQKGVEAYQAHTGEPLNPALIRLETPL